MKNGAQLLVECLQKENVKYIFGIPGAKVDAVFDALVDSGPELILCRHEQNASFMAACVGRLTGSPGVVLVTSGPGVSNLTTGLATATTEGDPVVALGGAVSRSMQLKQTHQSMNNVRVMQPVCKSSVEIVMPESIPEVVSNAFRLACEPRSGATFISLPQDILSDTVNCEAMPRVQAPRLGAAPDSLYYY
ncbi:thiamine pyrophosphate-binding protein [Methyloprofundus sp.]|uniref:thiamine pyrophosphate-binding protein n=1 Tax=Methyloprofundus sp. TaxID=2020875 RepID=UPI003D116E39